jgi:hypothetical protein
VQCSHCRQKTGKKKGQMKKKRRELENEKNCMVGGRGKKKENRNV